MLDKNKQQIFSKIKQLNRNAKEDNYKNMSVNQMLAILTNMQNKAKQTSNNKSSKNIVQPDLPNEDYETDESMESKTGKGLEYFELKPTICKSFDIEEKEELDESFTLKGLENNKSFDIAYADNKERLEKFKDEMQPAHKDITMWIEEDLTESKIIESSNKLTLYHNTSNENAIKINKEGIIPGLRKDVYGKGSEAEGSGIWCSTERGYGYGGATITFQIDKNDRSLEKENDTEYMVFRKIEPEEIVDIDLVVSKIVINKLPSITESAIPLAIEKYGKEKCYKVFEKYAHNFVEPYNMEQLKHLIETGEKYCKGTIKIESKNKLNEGIHLVAYVKSPYEDGVKTIEDNDYSSKTEFANDLKANEYTVLSVNDNRDLYVADNSDFGKLAQLVEKMKFYKQMWEDAKKRNPDSTLFKDDYEKLKAIYDEAMKQPLNESFKVTELDNTIENITKQTLIDRVNKLVKQYGKTEAGYQLAYEFNDSFYQEDKRKSKIQYVKDCINNCYKDNEDNEDNRDIIRYIDNAERRLSNKPNKLEEASRNELLAKTKGETITRYNKAKVYRGFSIVDIDTTSVLTTNCFRVTCRVGDYYDTVEMQDILYWVQLEAEQNKDRQVNAKGVTNAIMNSIDGMDIKVDCECRRFSIQICLYGDNFRIQIWKTRNKTV